MVDVKLAIFGVLLLFSLAFAATLTPKNVQITGKDWVFAENGIYLSFPKDNSLTATQLKSNCLLVSSKQGYLCTQNTPTRTGKTELQQATRQLQKDERKAETERVKLAVQKIRQAYADKTGRTVAGISPKEAVK